MKSCWKIFRSFVILFKCVKKEITASFVYFIHWNIIALEVSTVLQYYTRIYEWKYEGNETDGEKKITDKILIAGWTAYITVVVKNRRSNR